MIQLLDLPLHVLLALWMLRHLQPKVKVAQFTSLKQLAQDEARLADVIRTVLVDRYHEPGWLERWLYIIVENHCQSIDNNLEKVKAIDPNGNSVVGFIPFHE